MKKILHPSLTLGARRPFLRKTEGNLARIDMILHTNIGDLPWNPEFGCDLTSLVGEAATPEKIDHTESEVRRLHSYISSRCKHKGMHCSTSLFWRFINTSS